MKTITIKCSAKELNEVVSGERKVITREIRPGNARRYVELNEAEECTGIIPYEAAILQCAKYAAQATVMIKLAMLMEIEDENGELVYYEQNGKTYQIVDIDYHLGEIVDKTGDFPLLSNPKNI